MREIVENAWLLPLGTANTVLLRQGDELTLIDAGFPGQQQVVFDAIAKLGKRLSDLRHLVFTHGHPDHIGSAAALVRATGARTYMHATDAPLAESGGPFRLMTAGRGLIQKIGFRLFWDPAERVEPFKIDLHISDGELLPVAGGLRAIHAPGHCAGQVAFLWQGTRLLIAGDVFTNLFGLGDPVGFEDEAKGRLSQRKLAGLTFEAAAFGHGKAITRDATVRLRGAVA
ncbi:MAG TPA: MBL fold metallo-hydrolase [Acidisoma sp.]|jgi:glyoxylase-like metal-dependent hydrolase (beta-lactamase superfamily II)|nr:MBL fold metallo-hydrolase [Acidisoma sp.]